MNAKRLTMDSRFSFKSEFKFQSRKFPITIKILGGCSTLNNFKNFIRLHFARGLRKVVSFASAFQVAAFFFSRLFLLMSVAHFFQRVQKFVKTQEA